MKICLMILCLRFVFVLFFFNKSFNMLNDRFNRSIINFYEFYDESFEGGREYFRVLNELVSDYVFMLYDPKF